MRKKHNPMAIPTQSNREVFEKNFFSSTQSVTDFSIDEDRYKEILSFLKEVSLSKEDIIILLNIACEKNHFSAIKALLAISPVIKSLSIKSNLLIARDDFYTQENIILKQINNGLILSKLRDCTPCEFKSLLLNVAASSDGPKKYLIESIVDQPTNKFVLDAIASLMITYGYDQDAELSRFFKKLPPLDVLSDLPVVIEEAVDQTSQGFQLNKNPLENAWIERYKDYPDKYQILFSAADNFKELQCLLNSDPIKICEFLLMLAQSRDPCGLNKTARDFIASSFDVAMKTVCHSNNRFLAIFVIAWFNKMLGNQGLSINLIEYMEQCKNLFFIVLFYELNISNTKASKTSELDHINYIVRRLGVSEDFNFAIYLQIWALFIKYNFPDNAKFIFDNFFSKRSIMDLFNEAVRLKCAVTIHQLIVKFPENIFEDKGSLRRIIDVAMHTFSIDLIKKCFEKDPDNTKILFSFGQYLNQLHQWSFVGVLNEDFLIRGIQFIFFLLDKGTIISVTDFRNFSQMLVNFSENNLLSKDKKESVFKPCLDFATKDMKLLGDLTTIHPVLFWTLAGYQKIQNCHWKISVNIYRQRIISLLQSCHDNQVTNFAKIPLYKLLLDNDPLCKNIYQSVLVEHWSSPQRLKEMLKKNMLEMAVIILNGQKVDVTLYPDISLKIYMYLLIDFYPGKTSLLPLEFIHETSLLPMVKKHIIACIKNVMNDMIFTLKDQKYYLQLSACAASEELIQAFLSCVVQGDAVESRSIVGFNSDAVTELNLKSPFVVACDYPNVTEESVELLIPFLGDYEEVLAHPVCSERSPAYYYFRKHYNKFKTSSPHMNDFFDKFFKGLKNRIVVLLNDNNRRAIVQYVSVLLCIPDTSRRDFSFKGSIRTLVNSYFFEKKSEWLRFFVEYNDPFLMITIFNYLKDKQEQCDDLYNPSDFMAIVNTIFDLANSYYREALLKAILTFFGVSFLSFLDRECPGKISLLTNNELLAIMDYDKMSSHIHLDFMKNFIVTIFLRDDPILWGRVIEINFPSIEILNTLKQANVEKYEALILHILSFFSKQVKSDSACYVNHILINVESDDKFNQIIEIMVGWIGDSESSLLAFPWNELSEHKLRVMQEYTVFEEFAIFALVARAEKRSLIEHYIKQKEFLKQAKELGQIAQEQEELEAQGNQQEEIQAVVMEAQESIPVTLEPKGSQSPAKEVVEMPLPGGWVAVKDRRKKRARQARYWGGQHTIGVNVSSAEKEAAPDQAQQALTKESQASVLFEVSSAEKEAEPNQAEQDLTKESQALVLSEVFSAEKEVEPDQAQQALTTEKLSVSPAVMNGQRDDERIKELTETINQQNAFIFMLQREIAANNAHIASLETYLNRLLNEGMRLPNPSYHPGLFVPPQSQIPLSVSPAREGDDISHRVIISLLGNTYKMKSFVPGIEFSDAERSLNGISIKVCDPGVNFVEGQYDLLITDIKNNKQIFWLVDSKANKMPIDLVTPSGADQSSLVISCQGPNGIHFKTYTSMKRKDVESTVTGSDVTSPSSAC